MSLSLNRRTLLAGGLASGALLAAGCSSSGPDLSGAQAVDESKFPTYRQVTLAEPDLPGSDLVMPAYFTYPTDPAPAYDSPPAAEFDHVSILYNTFVPVPLGPDRNSFWQLAQEGTGTEFAAAGHPERRVRGQVRGDHGQRGHSRCHVVQSGPGAQLRHDRVVVRRPRPAPVR
ncbi:hypothetical protein [Parenemella sanctibonifatiensis]|uniref:hypothetical protein n=1 Tax=Parenemella sanctibonifatiensis TaxID=2016505 RepID=UPI001E4F9CFA|nr:hypothetical protein [Parenemella sanctibonifatiensis]